jgi:hypothetical protein
LLQALAFVPVLTSASVLMMGSTLFGAPGWIFTVGAAVLIVGGLISREATQRAGGTVALKAWRASAGWSASAFELHHDYDPNGDAVNELIEVTKAKGYEVVVDTESLPRASRTEWRFVRQGSSQLS